MRRLGLSVWLVVLLLAGCGGGGALSKKDLQKQLEAVQSFAAEGAFVADGAADERTTDIFVRVHTLYLGEGVQKVGKQVSAGHASGDLEEKRAAAIELASDVERQLERLHESPGDRDVACSAKAQLQRDAARAENEAK
jgi:hypothetical protein